MIKILGLSSVFSVEVVGDIVLVVDEIVVVNVLIVVEGGTSVLIKIIGEAVVTNIVGCLVEFEVEVDNFVVLCNANVSSFGLFILFF